MHAKLLREIGLEDVKLQAAPLDVLPDSLIAFAPAHAALRVPKQRGLVSQRPSLLGFW